MALDQTGKSKTISEEGRDKELLNYCQENYTDGFRSAARIKFLIGNYKLKKLSNILFKDSPLAFCW